MEGGEGGVGSAGGGQDGGGTAGTGATPAASVLHGAAYRGRQGRSASTCDSWLDGRPAAAVLSVK
ncbi:hypothetical protein HaLaN_26270 [Haematococcus lacustris]|uniref:Uncharacterized protein n=1 Tax=Haematococcus lacustris TaxID=44745 RepID=A0A6A0A5T7_HAELA|nr:hypothetical protein HaLaN_26270 [Haematococcus lacustris]